jgi:xylulokinase
MRRFLGLDIGTTRMKCGIYEESGKLVYADGCDYGTKQWGRETYLDVDAIVTCAKSLLKKAYSAYPFDSITISSLGESFVLLDEKDKVLFPPMLYTDCRGEEEAAELSAHAEKIFALSGVYPQGMYSAYKLLWIKKNRREVYDKAKKVMLVGDYVGYALTGKRCSDYASASRTGIFDIRKKEFSKELCALFGIEAGLFSPVAPSGVKLGEIKEEILSEWGASSSVTLVTGGHDQVCAALGAGAVEEGACADGMGTVECLTALYREPSADQEMGRCGYPNVPYAVNGLYCTYLLNYSCGSLTRWWLESLYTQEEISDGRAFVELEKRFQEEPTGLLVLPYFAGAATPFQNSGAKGGILNLRLSDTPADIYKGILEGLCMEMRLNTEETEKYGVRPQKLIATGGGSASAKWLQIKADVTGLPVYPLIHKEAGICGAAMLGASALTGESLSTLTERFVKTGKPFMPSPERKAEYDVIYEKYKKLYKTIKEFY